MRINYSTAKKHFHYKEEANIDTSTTKMDIEVLVSSFKFGLFDDMLNKLILLSIQNLSFKLFQGGDGGLLKAKAGLENLLLENCDPKWISKRLRTVIWLGPTQEPRRDETHDQLLKEVDENLHTVKIGLSQRKSMYTNCFSEKEIKDIRMRTSMKKKSFNETGHKRQSDIFSRILGESFMSQSVFPNKTQELVQGEVGSYEKGFLFFFEKTEEGMQVSLSTINFVLYWDLDFIRFLQEEVKKFTDKLKKYNNISQETDPILFDKETEAQKKKNLRPQRLSETEEKIQITVRVRNKRFCLVCRAQGRSLSDIVVLNTRISLDMLNTRKLINVYSKKLGVRDLTGYPLTKSPEEFKDYTKCKKQHMVSFKEEEEKDQKDVNNNGLVIILEIINPEFQEQGEDKVGTRAEVFLNNGEVDFFVQPVLRLLDFANNSMLAVLVPDTTLTLDKETLVKNTTNPSKTVYNIFIENLKVNLRPNFLVKEYLTTIIPKISISNSVDVDPDRNLKGKAKKLYTETVSIFVYMPRITGYRNEIEMGKIEQIEVRFAKLSFGNMLQRLYGKEKCNFIFKIDFKEIDFYNKIDVRIHKSLIKIRREEFFCLMTVVFNNIAFSDSMDNILSMNPPRGEVQPGKLVIANPSRNEC